MSDWTPKLVEERLIEAADVLKRLPGERIRGFFNTWPEIMVEFSDLVGREAEPMKRPPPHPAAIARMDETLTWTVGLEAIDGKIVWMRVHGASWKTICWAVGLQRSAAHEHWHYALCLIAMRLNRQPVPPNRSRRYVIDRMRDIASCPRA
ncbi:DUF6362 family protein [Pararhizobium haloflavum]|uniref:DUF6362 family protein n=1 Tax=Pararhizobium haloflavum TaxID=2037914 RepID=UPI000C1992BA|nr:DUF6362 family protein [Pararhizobium haloflavum]